MSESKAPEIREERYAALNRLLASNQALMDKSSEWWKRTQDRALTEMKAIRLRIDKLTDGKTRPAEREDHGMLLVLQKRMKELQEMEAVAAEMIDRLYCGIEGDEYGQHEPGSGFRVPGGGATPSVGADHPVPQPDYKRAGLSFGGVRADGGPSGKGSEPTPASA